MLSEVSRISSGGGSGGDEVTNTQIQRLICSAAWPTTSRSVDINRRRRRHDHYHVDLHCAQGKEMEANWCKR